MTEIEKYKAALTDIAHFHDKGYKVDDLEKRWGFLGWTCCGQLQDLAKKALGLE